MVLLVGDDPGGGAFALFFCPHPGVFEQLTCLHPGEFANLLKKMLMPGGVPGGGGGTAGIDWCIIYRTNISYAWA